MVIRREVPGDVSAVRDIIATAFAQPASEGGEQPSSGGEPPSSGDAPPSSGGVPIEVTLLDELRVDEGWIPKLSLVAEDPSGEVVGYVVCTRGHVGQIAAVGLGPIGVRPDRQGAGIGTALMHAVLGAAEALDEPFVALLGSQAYYNRFGFRPSVQFAIAPPDPQWGDYFQVRPLTAFTPVTGTFAYAEPFQRL